jgi:hypothetical protein
MFTYVPQVERPWDSQQVFQFYYKVKLQRLGLKLQRLVSFRLSLFYCSLWVAEYGKAKDHDVPKFCKIQAIGL